ncbi:tyrosine-type recombinase/integrase, partial [Vibrio anguillarum]
NFKSIKLVREDNTRIRYLTVVEEEALFKALKARDKEVRSQRESANQFRKERNLMLFPTFDDVQYVDYLEPLVITAINTGLRRGELLSLRWREISFDKGYLTVTAQNAKSKMIRNVPLNN